MKRGMRKTAAACCIALLLLSGCGKTAGNVNSDTADSSKNQRLVRVIQI